MNLLFPIGYYFSIRVPLPSTIFKCSSIRILKLTRVNVSDLSDVNLPSLKTLHLTNVEFPNPECLALLLSKCVRLEELLLLYLEFPDDEVTTQMSTLNIGKLQYLVTAFVPVGLFSMEAISNVTFLSLHDEL
ncbi:hypothetical protein K1719_020860 [Acacia pycnantha]|nr:hypothetical protein K1719_020860 [Acacia pycnantha]